MKAIITTLSGLAVFGIGLWTDFWISRCSEATTEGVNYAFGNACQDRAFGLQALTVFVGAMVLFYGISLFRRTK